MTRVLVAEDEAGLAEAIAMVLQDEGYEVTTARNGRQALELLDRERPDVVLLDCMMPLLNGAEVLSNLRARPDAPPVVLMSAITEGELLRNCAGHVAFLRKPFGSQALLDAVKAAVRS